MTVMLIAGGTSHGKHLANRTQGLVTVAAGAAELVGNVLFIVMAPKTEIFIGAGQIATRGAGVTIAMVAGVVLIISGVLMLVSRNRRVAVLSAPSALSTLAG